MSASIRNEPRIRKIVVKEIIAPTIKDAVIKLDDWCKSKYDFFLISVEELPEDFYIKMVILGTEHNWSRYAYPV